MNIAAFDTSDAERINKARKDFLDILLPDIVRKENITAALDAGCGFGFFSRYLKDMGLKVTAFDGRPENVAEAGRRNADVEFKEYNVEESSVVSLGRFDLVLCVGLLYHLENPFQAIRNLAALTGKILFVETVIAPAKSIAAFLYEEDRDQNQGVNYIALIPTESWFIKCFYCTGFPFVYKARRLPNHEDFHTSLIKKQRRTILIASKTELSLSSLQLIPEPETERYMWDSIKIDSLLHSERMRRVLRSGFHIFNSLFRR